MGTNRRRSYGGKPQRPEHTRKATGHTFLIVVEGRATERDYFDGLRAKLQLHAKVDVLFPHATDPRNIVRRAIQLRDAKIASAANSPREVPYSRVWVVFDTESPNHARAKQMPSALAMARKENIRVAVSNVAFELWLLLHYKPRPGAFNNCKALIAELKKSGIADYAKNALPLDELLDPKLLAKAVKHASECRRHHRGTAGIGNPSTRVDRLVWALNAAAAPTFRLL
jgi:hypothetical protein